MSSFLTLCLFGVCLVLINAFPKAVDFPAEVAPDDLLARAILENETIVTVGAAENSEYAGSTIDVYYYSNLFDLLYF